MLFNCADIVKRWKRRNNLKYKKKEKRRIKRITKKGQILMRTGAEVEMRTETRTEPRQNK